ncbi:MAG: hypothetical protein ACREL4_05725 [Gemmatimonadales bacterium]
MLRKLAPLTLSTLFAVAPLSAQVSITPFGGRIFPLRSMIIDTSGGSAAYFRMGAHSMYGLQVSHPVAAGVAVEVVAGVGSGTMELLSGGSPLTLASTVYFADLRGRLKLIGTEASQLSLIAGGGWTQYSMGVFDAAHQLNDSTTLKGAFTGIIGLGFQGKVSERFSLTADLTDRIHSEPLETPFSPASASKPTQHDLAFALGASFPLGR